MSRRSPRSRSRWASQRRRGGAIAERAIRSCPARTISGSAAARHHRARRHGSLPERDRRALPRSRRADDVTYIGPEWATAVPYVVHVHRAAGAPAGHPRHAASRGRGHGMTDAGASAVADGTLKGGGRRRARAGRRAAVAVDRRGRGGRAAARAVPRPLGRPLLPEHVHPLDGLRHRAVGLNVITGYAGYVSLGQGAFIGLARIRSVSASTRSGARRGSGCRRPV